MAFNIIKKFMPDVKDFAKGVLTDTVAGVAEKSKADLVDVLKDAVSDTIHGMVARKESIIGWAELAASGIDPIIERTAREENLQYVGGKLIFSFSEKNTEKVDIAFDLFFIDEEKNWKKVSAHSDVYASTFTNEALEELRASGVIEYAIEG